MTYFDCPDEEVWSKNELFLICIIADQVDIKAQEFGLKSRGFWLVDYGRLDQSNDRILASQSWLTRLHEARYTLTYDC